VVGSSLYKLVTAGWSLTKYQQVDYGASVGGLICII
jgi:hypothetical protein